MKNYNKVGKYQVFGDILKDYFQDKENITVLEYGRLRSLAGSDKLTDGWSTKILAEHPKVAKIYSLDTDKSTIKKCKELIDEKAEEKVTYAEKVTQFNLKENSIDLLFLDADNNPNQCNKLYDQAKKYLKRDGYILIDDVFDNKGHKGDILIPRLKTEGCLVKEYHPFALVLPYSKKNDVNISVCIFTYLRPHVLDEQLEAIKNQSIQPNEIIIGHLQNEKTSQYNFEKRDLKLINFHFDPGIHTKFILATAVKPQTDFIAILDDDVIPGSKWLENCLNSYKKKEGVYGILGFNLTSSYCMHSAGREFLKDEIVQVDFVGQGWFFPYKYLQYMWTEPFPSYNQNGDDIWFGYQLAKHGVNCYIPPYPGDNQEMWGHKDMRAGAESLFKRDSKHHERRNQLLKLAKDRGWKPLYIDQEKKWRKLEAEGKIKSPKYKVNSKARIVK